MKVVQVFVHLKPSTKNIFLRNNVECFTELKKLKSLNKVKGLFICENKTSFTFLFQIPFVLTVLILMIIFFDSGVMQFF